MIQQSMKVNKFSFVLHYQNGIDISTRKGSNLKISVFYKTMQTFLSSSYMYIIHMHFWLFVIVFWMCSYMYFEDRIN